MNALDVIHPQLQQFIHGCRERLENTTYQWNDKSCLLQVNSFHHQLKVEYVKTPTDEQLVINITPGMSSTTPVPMRILASDLNGVSKMALRTAGASLISGLAQAKLGMFDHRLP
jgi:hypothetical protein